MKNLDSRNALGFTVGLDPDTEHSEYYPAIGPRYRRWLNRYASIDCMASVTIGGAGSKAHLPFRNVSLQAVLMGWDMVGVDAGIILDRVEEGEIREKVRPFLGIRLGSYPAVSAALTSIIVWLAAMAISLPFADHD